MSYEQLKKRSDQWGESADCTVTAFAVLLGGDDIAYDLARTHLAEHGRKRGEGMRMEPYVEAIRQAGIPLKKYTRADFVASTPITAQRDPFFKKGHFILEFVTHVAAMVDGEVIDWTATRKHRIMAAYKVE